MTAPLKISSPETQQFWEIPVLFEDEHLLALDKPARLPAAPETGDQDCPNLTRLLHAAIAAGKPWTRERGLSYLMPAHNLDAGASGVLLLAKSKPVFMKLADWFGADRPGRKYLVLV